MATPRYIQASDLIQKIPSKVQGLLTNDGTTLTADSSRLKEAILEAEGDFESYVAERYDLPVKAADGTVPPNVESKIITLAKYHLYSRRDAISKEIQVQYDAAVRWLERVQAGKASIPLIDSNNEVEDEGAQQITVNEKTNSQFDTFV